MKEYVAFVISFAIVLALYLAVVAPTALARLAISFVVVVLVVLVLVASVLFMYALERLKSLRAERVEKEKRAHVMIVSDNQETWVRDTDDKAVWRNLTGTPLLRVNGKYQEPTDWEIELHKERLYAAMQTTQPKQIATLDMRDEVRKLDLLQVFTQTAQAYAIIGGQQTGKTFQARHIAAYWAREGVRPIVIAPKFDQDEWMGCVVIGGNGDYNEVERGIEKVRKLAARRHESDALHKSHAPQPIFFDDWTTVVKYCDNARDLIFEATTLYASVNIVLYFIIHSDTSSAWGVDRVGAALKENFIKLLISPTYNEKGELVRDDSRAVIRFAGSSDDHAVDLFRGAPRVYAPRVHKKIAIEKVEPVLVCPVCGGSREEHQKYCTNACKQKAYRARKSS